MKEDCRLHCSRNTSEKSNKSIYMAHDKPLELRVRSRDCFQAFPEMCSGKKKSSGISTWHRTCKRQTKQYADAPSRLQDGTTGAKKGALNRGAIAKVSSLCNFVQDVTAERTELCARPEVGFAELADTLDNFFVNVEELGGGRDFKELAKNAESYQLGLHLRVLHTMFKM